MLKAKIKISQITNLTDARYFAAWGVDYLGFDINPDSDHFTSPALVAEISEWVEGPMMILESSSVPDAILLGDYEKALKKVIVEAPVPGNRRLSSFTDPDSGNRYAVFHSDQAWSSHSLATMGSLVKSYDHILLDIPFSTHEVDMILDAGIAGFVVRGGDEEKVGFKSYDGMDELFEFLSD
jgi:phosphoribosylanthranilate isomerase